MDLGEPEAWFDSAYASGEPVELVGNAQVRAEDEDMDAGWGAGNARFGMMRVASENGGGTWVRRAPAESENENPERPIDMDLSPAERIEDAQRAYAEANAALKRAIREACPGPHAPVQHRDHRPPWCPACGRDPLGYVQRPAGRDL